jgi:hypothetical protein
MWVALSRREQNERMRRMRRKKWTTCHQERGGKRGQEGERRWEGR